MTLDAVRERRPDLAGNAASTTPVNETGTADRDF